MVKCFNLAIKSFFLTIFLVTVFSVRAAAMTVVLDPGHGGGGSSGSGAVYPPFYEKSLNLAVAEGVRDELEAAGVTVYMTREDDNTALSLEERADYAAECEADLLVSIHFNSSGPHDKYGSEVWTSFVGPYFKSGVSLGNAVLKELCALGFANKGVKTRLGNSGDYYGIIRHGVSHGIPTVIVEHCFIDSAIDRPMLDEIGVSGLAHADAAGILNYLSDASGVDLRNVSKSHSAPKSPYESYTNASAVHVVEDGYYPDIRESSESHSSDSRSSAAHPVRDSKIYGSQEDDR